MGLIHFNELFNSDNMLGLAKIPFDKPEGAEILKNIMGQTTIAFVDLTFLLTSGRSMQFGTGAAFITDPSDKDLLKAQKASAASITNNNNEDTEDISEDDANLKGAYPPLTMDNLADYMIDFVDALAKSRPSLKNIIFGTDNHVHVPVTKLREWHHRDYHKNYTYESHDGTLRHELRGPFSRTDEGLISNLVDLLEHNDTDAFRQQLLGLTFTRADPMLDAFLTDRYIRPFFVSLLFQLVHQKLTAAQERRKITLARGRKLTVFIMHAVYNFAGFCNKSKIKFLPNVYEFEGGKDGIDSYATDDGLHIGEADIQFLWMLEKIGKNKSESVELLCNDSDLLMIILNYYIKTKEDGAYILVWLSDTKCIRAKFMYSHVIPNLMKAKKLPERPLLFFELCLCFFKNDYYDQPFGMVASITRFNAFLTELGKYYDAKPNENRFLDSDCIVYSDDGSMITFKHMTIFNLRLIMLLMYIRQTLKKNESPEEEQLIKRYLDMLIDKIDEGDEHQVYTELQELHWKRYINKMNVPLTIKNAIQRSIDDNPEAVVYPSEMTALLQRYGARFVQNDEKLDIFERDFPNLNKVEPNHEKLWFWSISDDYGCIDGGVAERLSAREIDDGKGRGGGDDTSPFLEDEDLEMREQGNDEYEQTVKRCKSVKSISDVLSGTRMVFAGELNAIALSSFAGMFEWLVTYWNIGYYECASKQMPILRGVEVNPIIDDEDILMKLNTRADKNNAQFWPLLRIANYGLVTCACGNDMKVIVQMKRDSDNKKMVYVDNVVVDFNERGLTGNDPQIEYVRDAGTVIRKSGVLFVHNEHVNKAENNIHDVLMKLAKVCLFRMINLVLVTTNAAWIDDFTAEYEKHCLGIKTKEGAMIQLCADEHLIFKLAAAKFCIARHVMEPFYSTAKQQTLNGVSSLVLFTPTMVASNMDNTVNVGGTEFQNSRDDVYPDTFETRVFEDTDKETVTSAGERDLLGEFDTCFFAGLIFPSKLEASVKSAQDSVRFLTTSAYKTLSHSHPFTGTRVVHSQHIVSAITEYDATFKKALHTNATGMVPAAQLIDVPSMILSDSLDVNDYALPLLKFSIDDAVWKEVTCNIVRIFQKPMEVAFFTFMEWKCNQSIYLRFLLYRNVRNKKTQTWRNTLFMVPLFFGFPKMTALPPWKRVDKLAAVTKGPLKFWATFAMAYLDLEGKNDVYRVSEVNNLRYCVDAMDLEDNMPLRMMCKYIPLCNGLYANIRKTNDEENHVITLFFKKWPEHLFFHYIYHTFITLYEDFVVPVLRALKANVPELDQYIAKPYFLAYKRRIKPIGAELADEDEEEQEKNKIMQKYEIEFLCLF